MFVLSALIFLLGFFGLAVSLWPYVVPRHITIWNGAADPQTLWFVGIGLCFILPIVLAYQFHAYWVFRGKTRAEEIRSDRPDRAQSLAEALQAVPLGTPARRRVGRAAEDDQRPSEFSEILISARPQNLLHSRVETEGAPTPNSGESR